MTLLPLLSCGQQICVCKHNGKYSSAASVFLFENKEFLGIHGYREKPGVYSEFILVECSSKRVIGEWSALQTCKAKMLDDTLQLSELFLLPTGKKFAYQQTPFLFYKYYYADDKLLTTSYYDKRALIYSDKQINASLEKYKKAKKGNTEENLEVADMLFCAYVSGSKQAEDYLNQLKMKLGPFDGAIAEQWDSLWQLYLHYKTQTDKPLQKEIKR